MQRRCADFVRTCKSGRETGAHVSATHRKGDIFTVQPVFLLSCAIRRICSGNASLIGSIGQVSTIYLT